VSGPLSHRRAQRGAVLVFTLVVVVILTLGLALVVMVLDERQRALRLEIAGIELTALTDAALALTLAELASDPNYSGARRRELGRGEIESSVELLSPDAAEVLSRATFLGRSRTTRARVFLSRGAPRVLEWAVEPNTPAPAPRDVP
jgi:hypothetical protein